jgi:hypothetical protein
MTSIVSAILNTTVGLLSNKARDVAAYKLKGGDITDEKIREIVVRELSDIKSKLDGLSRRDLLSSYGFLKEGVNFLYASLDKSKDDGENAIRNGFQDETSTVRNSDRSGILNGTLELSSVVEKLKSISGKEFESAKKRFEEARKTATYAFWNEALSIKDRIFAAKLRVCSEILECLESPETAITGCATFLHDLHGLPAIREIFSVHLNGGIKSKLNKEERVDNVKSVMMINYALYQFSFRFTSTNVIWPGEIKLADRSFNPILNWQEISTRKSWCEGPLLPQNDLLLDESIRPYHSAFNSHGDIIAVRSDDDLKVISKNGETKLVTLPNVEEDKVIEHSIKGFAVDQNNNVYIVRCVETRAENGDVKKYVLYVLDETYNAKHKCTLEFVEASGHGMKLTINKDGDIIMTKNDYPCVYVCDSSGNLKFTFERDAAQTPRYAFTTSNENDIIISSHRNTAVAIYTEEGKLKLIFNLPADQRVVGVAFNYICGKIVVLSVNMLRDTVDLLWYTINGELETSIFYSERNLQKPLPDVISSPNGPLAILHAKKIVYL